MTTHIFYETSGKIQVATVVQASAAAYTVDTPHGKRVKIKTAQVLLEFKNQAPLNFLAEAESIAQGIDIQLLWEVCSEQEAEFEASFAAAEYFGTNAKTVELAATLMAIYNAPIYFYKKSKQLFKAAPKSNIQAALQAIEKKKAQELQIATWVNELAQGCLPHEIEYDLRTILHTPNKQSTTYKAFMQAANAAKKSAFEFALHLGAIQSLAQYFLDEFIVKHYPHSLVQAASPVPLLPDLPVAEHVEAFSIDSQDTSEIDDALSLRQLDDNTWQIGIHIAAPSLAIEAESAMERNIFERQSTVYYPSGKITMLPDNWIAAFSLNAGDVRCAISLYVTINKTGEILATTTRAEKVKIAHNLRIEAIEALFNPKKNPRQNNDFHMQAAMNVLYDLSIARRKIRGVHVENAPERFDYSVSVDTSGNIRINTRQRDTPIDILVSEMMILAGSTWAKMLDEAELGGLFRVQSAGSRVRMSTKVGPHAGMALQHYGWFTSPLRRAADYVNQRQLLSLILPDTEPRFSNKDSDLFAVLNQFDTAYASYLAFQRQMEFYWSLEYLIQENVKEVYAHTIRDDLVRLDGLPVVTRALGIPFDLPANSRVLLAISDIQPANLHLGLRYEKAIAPT